MKIHPKITKALPSIKRTILTHPKTKLYAKVNHQDNFVMVVTPMIMHEIMNIVVNMTGSELTWEDWWDKGFRNSRTSSKTPDHSELQKISCELAQTIYKQLRLICHD